MLIFLIILIIAALYFFRLQDQPIDYRSVQTMPAPSSSSDSLEILRQRYVRGEIDEQEFKERKNVLEQR
ncbi:SHOCT domain-containing protein [Desulfitobacterium sp.]|uniref:SHOCT domain-containing protein n=1 Tax=Desulfitobacterium sp. TaxID=49981 RepID=UPI002CB16D4A|nr:SHOCT domain-containing protein [Desulfitobacterium sp.]HVJ47694.1 SHOCT domain-containing protein [Desulfitobacterium sp.]